AYFFFFLTFMKRAQLHLTSRLREVEFLRQPTKIQFGKISARDFPLNRCYVSRRLKGGERSEAKSEGF
ncbi:hypothetical protein ACFLTH_12695, partial [Bacteroidota bacterium]